MRKTLPDEIQALKKSTRSSIEFRRITANAYNDAIDDVLALLKEGPTHEHIKRGTRYRVIGAGKLQTDAPLEDMAEVVVYVGEEGDLWVRTIDEFTDGRFKEIKCS